MGMSSPKTMMMIQKPKVPKMKPVPPKVTMAPLSPPTQHPTFDINETKLIDINNDTLPNNETRFLKKEETTFLKQKQTKQESSPIFGSYPVFILFAFLAFFFLVVV